MSHQIQKTAYGLALREAREKTPGVGGRCLSQNAIGQELGMDAHTIGEYERGDGGVPPDEVILAYAKLTGQTFGQIMEAAAAHTRRITRRRGEPPAAD